MSALVSWRMRKSIGSLDIPPIGEFLELIHDSGCGMYACKATVDMFKMTKADFVSPVDEIITASHLGSFDAVKVVYQFLKSRVLLAR